MGKQAINYLAGGQRIMWRWMQQQEQQRQEQQSMYADHCQDVDGQDHHAQRVQVKEVCHHRNEVISRIDSSEQIETHNNNINNYIYKPGGIEDIINMKNEMNNMKADIAEMQVQLKRAHEDHEKENVAPPTCRTAAGRGRPASAARWRPVAAAAAAARPADAGGDAAPAPAAAAAAAAATEERIAHLEKLLGDSADKHAQDLKALKAAHDKHASDLADLQAAHAHHASLPKRIDYIEKHLSDSADKRAQEMKSLRDAHSKRAQDMEDRNATVEQRIKYAEKLLGDSAEKHAKELKTVAERLDYMETMLGDFADKHAKDLQVIKLAHDKHARGLAEAVDTRATMEERIKYIEKFLGHFIDEHAAEIRALKDTYAKVAKESEGNVKFVDVLLQSGVKHDAEIQALKDAHAKVDSAKSVVAPDSECSLAARGWQNMKVYIDEENRYYEQKFAASINQLAKVVFSARPPVVPQCSGQEAGDKVKGDKVARKEAKGTEEKKPTTKTKDKPRRARSPSSSSSSSCSSTGLDIYHRLERKKKKKEKKEKKSKKDKRG